MEKTQCRITGVEGGKNVVLNRMIRAVLVEKAWNGESLLCGYLEGGILEYFLEYSLPRVFQIESEASAQALR